MFAIRVAIDASMIKPLNKNVGGVVQQPRGRKWRMCLMAERAGCRTFAPETQDMQTLNGFQARSNPLSGPPTWCIFTPPPQKDSTSTVLRPECSFTYSHPISCAPIYISFIMLYTQFTSISSGIIVEMALFHHARGLP